MLKTTNQLRIAFRALVQAKLGGPQNARKFGKGRTHFLETYIIDANEQMDEHSQQTATIAEVVDQLIGITKAGVPIAELTLCINERDPLDLIDEIGITYDEILVTAGIPSNRL